MNGGRTLTLPSHLQGAKIAFGELVNAFGGQAAASAETGKSQPRLSDYARQNTGDFPPLDVIDALEARTVGTAGHPHVTGWLARRRGFELVKLPDASAPPMPVTALVSDLIKACGQLTSGILNDLSGDGLGPIEAWRRLGEADDLVRVAINIRAALKAKAGEEGG